MRSRLWLVLALFVVLCIPTEVVAEEYKSNPEESTQIEMVKAAPQTPMQLIRNWFNALSFNMSSIGTVRLTALNRFVSGMFRNGNWNGFFKLSIALVFLIWGVRKVIKMIFRALRKGKINA